MSANHSYGWKRQRLDKRDRKLKVMRPFSLPKSVDLRPGMPDVYDQGNLGSCTANAAAGLFEFAVMKARRPAFTPSRLFVYYHERVIEGTVKTDAGAELRDAAKVLGKIGVCTEATWPYAITRFTKAPSFAAESEAVTRRAKTYTAVDNTDLNALRTVLAGGSPVMFGFTVFESFESDAVARSGVVPLPKAKSEQLLGGHAVVLCGYDDARKRFLVRNSWGASWGLGGYCWMPYAYLTDADLASDFWVITL